MMQLYRIVRFYYGRWFKRRTIRTGQTLKQAQDHCKRKDTCGPDWFDGYERE